MLKEEKELRNYIHDGIAFAHYNWIPKHINRLITALVRAVREDCAKIAEETLRPMCSKHDDDAPRQVAAAIRSRK